MGFTNCGIAVLELPSEQILMTMHYCVKRDTKKKTVRAADEAFARCQGLARMLHRILREHHVAGAIIELPHGGAQSSAAMRDMARGSAIVAAVLELNGVPVEAVTPTDVKRITGKTTGVSKAEVAVVVTERWPTFAVGISEHEADALGAYISARDGQLMPAADRAKGRWGMKSDYQAYLAAWRHAVEGQSWMGVDGLWHKAYHPMPEPPKQATLRARSRSGLRFRSIRRLRLRAMRSRAVCGALGWREQRGDK